MEQPIVFWATDADEANLAVLARAGLPSEAAIRTALDRLAAEMTPVAWALSGDLADRPA